jgi:GSH-dependent disulfide-bond oxidoreductase
MIDFYTLTSPNVQKVFIALEELALPYNTIVTDTWKGEHFTPEFTKLNPNQKIPLIVDHDGPGGKPHSVFESGAILIYLADKTRKLIPSDPAKRSDVMQWLMVQMSAVGPYCGQVVHFSRFAPPGNEYALSRYKTEVNRLYDVYDRQLGMNRYVAGDEYSIADIAALPWLRQTGMLGVEIEKRPNVKRWVAELEARPAIKTTLAKIATITSARDSASDDMKDRIFGRGKYARA